MEKVITRRDFMRKTAVVAFGAAAGLKIEPQKRTPVVLIRDENVLDANSRIDENIIQRMVDSAVMTLTGEDNPVSAFKRYIKPDDIVGIKSNVWAYIPTPVELEKAIERRVLAVGVKRENISVDDRGVLRNPVFKSASAIINVRPVRTHYWSGIGGCIKNLIPFAPTPSKYHPDSCADLAQVWKLPAVKGKVRLNILCALTPLFHGRGPHHYDRRYVWAYNGIIAGKDPVAVDSVGLELIKAKRRAYFGKEISFNTIPKHIRVADKKYHLGVSDLNKIELIRLGWEKDRLI